MAKLSQLNLPIKDESTGQVTAQTFDIGGKEYSAGYGISISNTDEIASTTFVGTQAEWDALTPAEQAAFDIINITDDYTPSTEIQISYIDSLPVAGIKDVVYGLRSFGTPATATAADGFLDSVDAFTKTSLLPSGYEYTSGTAEISLDGVTYNNFSSIVYDGTKFVIDGETDLALGDTLYYRVLSGITYYGGDANAQTITPIGKEPVDVVADGNMNAVTSNAVYNEVADVLRTETVETIGGAASKTYTKRESFIGNNGIPYFAIPDINVGDTLIEGTNCSRLDIEKILDAHLLSSVGIVIPDNADFNTYTTAGVYRVLTNAVATTMSNMPIQQSGKLIVTPLANVDIRNVQIYMTQTAPANIYMRMQESANSWFDWVKYATTDSIKPIYNCYGAKNLIPYPYQFDDGYEDGGITYTINSDGSITANGTATQSSRYYFVTANSNKGRLLKGSTSYIISGGKNNNQKVEIAFYKNDTYISGSAKSSGSTETTFTTLSESDFEYCVIYIIISSGEVLDNVTFYPMIRYAGVEDNTYVPYAMTNRELTDNIANCITSAGGTVTGRITQRDTVTDVTQANNGLSSNTWYYLIGKGDKNNKGFAEIQSRIYTNGDVGLALQPQNLDSSGNIKTGSFNVIVDKSGVTKYEVTYGKNLRAELGFGYGTCNTAQATAAKEATIENYNLVSGSYVTIKFTNAVPANATLNINNKGAKPIYYLGVAIEDQVIGASDVATFIYDGSYYQLISVNKASIPTHDAMPSNYVSFPGLSINSNFTVAGTCSSQNLMSLSFRGRISSQISMASYTPLITFDHVTLKRLPLFEVWVSYNDTTPIDCYLANESNKLTLYSRAAKTLDANAMFTFSATIPVYRW